MQYTININQEKLANTKLDLIEAAILEYLYHYCSSVSPKIEKQRLVDDSGVWTWIDLKQLAKDMPLLRINNSTALSRRIPQIREAGFINYKHGLGKKLFVKLTPKCDSLYRKVEPEMTTNTSEMTDNTSRTNKIEAEMTNIISRNDEEQLSIYNTNTNNTNTNIKEKNNKKEMAVAIAPSPSPVRLDKYSLLEDITEVELEEIARLYQVPLSFVRSKYEDLCLWVGEKPGSRRGVGRNFKLTLMNWVKKDAIKLLERSKGDVTRRPIDASKL